MHFLETAFGAIWADLDVAQQVWTLSFGLDLVQAVDAFALAFVVVVVRWEVGEPVDGTRVDCGAPANLRLSSRWRCRIATPEPPCVVGIVSFVLFASGRVRLLLPVTCLPVGEHPAVRMSTGITVSTSSEVKPVVGASDRSSAHRDSGLRLRRLLSRRRSARTTEMRTLLGYASLLFGRLVTAVTPTIWRRGISGYPKHRQLTSSVDDGVIAARRSLPARCRPSPV